MKRRRFLRGLGGVALGIPFLESLAVRRLGAQPTAPNRRFVVVFNCNGVNMETFWPEVPFGDLAPASFDGPYGTAPLARHAEDLLVLRGVHQTPRGFGLDRQGGDDHQRGMGCKLTAQPLAQTPDMYATGISVDQYVAQQINPGGREPLNLLVGPQAGQVAGHISYRGSQAPVTPENDPSRAFQALVGLDPGNAEARERVIARRESVLDLVRDDLEDLRRAPLGRDDRDKLDMHFTAVRELELDIANLGLCDPSRSLVQEIEALTPEEILENDVYPRIGRLQVEVMVLALACGVQRVATLMWGTGAVGPIFRWAGMDHEYNHHKLSHGSTTDDDNGNPVDGYQDMLHAIDTWHMGELAHVLDRLKAYDEGEHGTILDQSAVLWINELSQGKVHDWRDLPIIVAGRCGGRLRPGRYLKMTQAEELMNDLDASHNKLLNTLINVTTRENDDDPRMDDFGWAGAQRGEFTELEG